MRALPLVPKTIPAPDYATPLAWGWDSWQEAYELRPSEALTVRLEAAQEKAKSLDDDGGGMVAFLLNGETFDCHATGAKGGYRFRLSNDDLIILIGSPKRDWSVSVRYMAAGLWEYGILALQRVVTRVLWTGKEFVGNITRDGVRLSRADYCFDFYSPGFSAEFVPSLVENVVCHSSTKARVNATVDQVRETEPIQLYARGGRGETLDIGSKKGLQVSIYNKSLEIVESSGKTWMIDLWTLNTAGEILWDGNKPRDVWRLEIRMAGTFLKDRNANRLDAFEKDFARLIIEALYNRRLATPTRDSNRARWPMHPLWSLAVNHFEEQREFMPLGRQVTGLRATLAKRAKQQIKGSLRSLSVLETGKFDSDQVLNLVMDIEDEIAGEKDHERKVEAAQNRYRTVDEAR